MYNKKYRLMVSLTERKRNSQNKDLCQLQRFFTGGCVRQDSIDPCKPSSSVLLVPQQ